MAKKIKNDLDDIINSSKTTPKKKSSNIKKPNRGAEDSTSIDFEDGNQNLYFLGGLTGAQAVSGGGQAAGMLSGMINPNTRGGGAASGALQGASMGASFGPIGMGAGALIGGVAGLISGGKAADQAREDEFNGDIKQRNQMLGIKAMGGELNEFNTGGRHQDNPMMGIPQGMAQDGTVNKVEEGETKWKDYIFSDRLTLDDNLIAQTNLPQSMKNKTFAEVSKRINKIAKERPNDPISRDTVKGQMQKLMGANDAARQYEESSMMAGGGRLYDGGGDVNFKDPRQLDRFNNPMMPMTSINPLGINTGLNTRLEVDKLNNNFMPKTGGKNKFSFDSKDLRYAPIAFDMLASTGLFGNSGKKNAPEEFKPTTIQQTGRLTASQIDEMQMRNAVDNSFQSGLSGMAEASGGSVSALRAGLSGLNNNYMSSIGTAYATANDANNGRKMQADQFNLQMQGNVASQNAQMMNQAGMYNNQAMNQYKAKGVDDRISYLAKGAESLGDIGYEQRMAEIMPKIYGYDKYGNFNPMFKVDGDRLRLFKHKK